MAVSSPASTKFLRVAEAALHAAEPEQVLVIAQAAAAALHVGLLEEDGVLEALACRSAWSATAPLEEFLFVPVQAAAGDEGFFEFG